MICEESFVVHDNWNISGATRLTIATGYGSRFDGHSYRAVICDDCVKRASDKGLVERGRFKHTPPEWISDGECWKTPFCGCTKCDPTV